MQIKIVNNSRNNIPSYETTHSAGMDIRANLDEPVTLLPMERAMIPTGLFIELPEGFEAQPREFHAAAGEVQIRPRSGLAAKSGITVLNSPGTIDADYRGEIKIILINLSEQRFVINHGDRIAQMIIARHEKAEWILTDVLKESERGDGGFGHTGVK